MKNGAIKNPQNVQEKPHLKRTANHNHFSSPLQNNHESNSKHETIKL